MSSGPGYPHIGRLHGSGTLRAVGDVTMLTAVVTGRTIIPGRGTA